MAAAVVGAHEAAAGQACEARVTLTLPQYTIAVTAIGALGDGRAADL